MRPFPGFCREPRPGQVMIENLLANSFLAVRAEPQLLEARLDYLIARRNWSA